MDDLIEECLSIFHGGGDYGWRLIKQTWPTAAIDEQRRKMKDVITLARKQMREALEAIDVEILLDGHLSELVDIALEDDDG